jgi:hypothetical protein
MRYRVDRAERHGHSVRIILRDCDSGAEYDMFLKDFMQLVVGTEFEGKMERSKWGADKAWKFLS